MNAPHLLPEHHAVLAGIPLKRDRDVVRGWLGFTKPSALLCEHHAVLAGVPALQDRDAMRSWLRELIGERRALDAKFMDILEFAHQGLVRSDKPSGLTAHFKTGDAKHTARFDDLERFKEAVAWLRDCDWPQWGILSRYGRRPRITEVMELTDAELVEFKLRWSEDASFEGDAP